MIEKWRCFLAITPGQEFNQKFRELVRQLDVECREAGQKVRWVHPSKLHLTLRFLGDIPVPLVAALEDAMRDVDSVGSFNIGFEGLGAFPDPAKPRVVWLGVTDPSSGLASLHRKVTSVLADQGIPADKREFSPHLTIGRVRKAEADLTGILEPRSQEVFGEMQVSEIVFYRSILDPSGAMHEAKWVAMLRRERRARR